MKHCSGDESDEPGGQSEIQSTTLHPVVFRWHGEGQKVLLAGSYDGWKTKIPLVRRYTSCLHFYSFTGNFISRCNLVVTSSKRPQIGGTSKFQKALIL